MAKRRVISASLVLLGLVVLSTALPVTKNEKKKDEAAAKEEQHVKYDEGYDKDDPRNRPDVSKSRVWHLS